MQKSMRIFPYLLPIPTAADRPEPKYIGKLFMSFCVLERNRNDNKKPQFGLSTPFQKLRSAIFASFDDLFFSLQTSLLTCLGVLVPSHSAS